MTTEPTTTISRRMNHCTCCLLLVVGVFLSTAVEGFLVLDTTTTTTTNTVPRRRLTVAASSSSSTAVPRTSFLSASNANELMPLKPGSTVALVTPFVPETGKIDVAGLRRLLQYHVASGTDNLCILGTTGEAGVLSMPERELVLKVAVEEVKGKLPIMVGTGTINPASVKAMTQQALDLGCDASLVVTPYYVKPPQRCLIQHFADAATYGLPVVIYNVPGRTAVDMTDESIAVAASLHENIVAVKDATGDVSRVASLRAALAKHGVERFLLYSGDDGTSIDFCLQGGDGCISVTANVAANAMHRLVQAARQLDQTAAAEINNPVALLHQKLFVESNPIPVKWALQRMGLMDSAWCRPPLDTMDPAYNADVETALRHAGLLDSN